MRHWLSIVRVPVGTSGEAVWRRVEVAGLVVRRSIRRRDELAVIRRAAVMAGCWVASGVRPPTEPLVVCGGLALTLYVSLPAIATIAFVSVAFTVVTTVAVAVIATLALAGVVVVALALTLTANSLLVAAMVAILPLSLVLPLLSLLLTAHAVTLALGSLALSLAVNPRALLALFNLASAFSLFDDKTRFLCNVWWEGTGGTRFGHARRGGCRLAFVALVALGGRWVGGTHSETRCERLLLLVGEVLVQRPLGHLAATIGRLGLPSARGRSGWLSTRSGRRSKWAAGQWSRLEKRTAVLVAGTSRCTPGRWS